MPIATLQTIQAPFKESSSFDPAEAARYAVLRRMGSAIRHQIAGALQPISMMASLLERRVQAASPNLDSLRKNSGEMSTLSRSASAECVGLMGWLAPQEGELVPVSDGIADCLHLLATELSFRGFSVLAPQDKIDVMVSRVALRSVLPAALMALTDAARHAAQVTISARQAADSISIGLSMLSTGSGETPGPPKGYRVLTWQDVVVLCEAEGVVLRLGEDTVEVRLPVLQKRGPPDGAEVRWG